MTRKFFCRKIAFTLFHIAMNTVYLPIMFTTKKFFYIIFFRLFRECFWSNRTLFSFSSIHAIWWRILEKSKEIFTWEGRRPICITFENIYQGKYQLLAANYFSSKIIWIYKLLKCRISQRTSQSNTRASRKQTFYYLLQIFIPFLYYPISNMINYISLNFPTNKMFGDKL